MTSSYTNWIDQLALYAVINKGAKTLESYSLDYVANLELGESKADFDGDISTAFIRDYTKFFKYNIQDAILLHMIESKVKHIDLLYLMSVITGTRPSHVFKKTISLRNLADTFYESKNFVISNNRSKLFPKKKEKIAGGFVGNPNLIDKVGIKLPSGLSNFIFDDATDIDLAALYPSVTQAFNISPETFMGKIEYKNSDNIDETIHFIDGYNSNDGINFGMEFLGLPSITDFIDIIDKEIIKN